MELGSGDTFWSVIQRYDILSSFQYLRHLTLTLLDVQGNFNLSRPPNPPECSGSFQYLHAVYPPNETERMALCSRYDILWPQFHNKNVGKVLLAAMSRFSTSFISVSIFDQKNEVFKVENGYNRSHIDRDASIAAHVLYSSDVMVVLDTKKVCVTAACEMF